MRGLQSERVHPNRPLRQSKTTILSFFTLEYRNVIFRMFWSLRFDLEGRSFSAILFPALCNTPIFNEQLS